MIDVALLGTGGMMPLPNRYLTSLLCRINGSLIQIDCGECTQVTMKLMGWGFKNIDVLCFTHFHADHISGLPGLLLTIGNSGRTEPIKVIGPKGIAGVVRSLCVIAPELPFEMEFIEAGRNFSMQMDGYTIRALPLDHRIVCYGYSIELPRIGKFDLERAKTLGIPITFWSRLQKGEIIEHEGRTYTPDMVLGKPRKGIKISYCTDTRPTIAIPAFINGSDLFVCEGIYGDAEKFDRVREHKHMIYAEAAKLAKAGNVGELWLTHFSPALTNPLDFLKNASDIFPNTFIGRDRMSKTIVFEN